MKISRVWNTGAAVTGLLFVILMIFGVLASIAPYEDLELTTSSGDIARAFIDGTDNLITGGYVLMMSAFLLIVFAGYLRHALSPESGPAWPASVGFGGGILTAALLTLVATFIIAQGQLLDYGQDTVIAKTLLVLSWVSVSIAIPGLAAFVGGMSLMGISYETLPRWLGWFGAVATVFVLTFWVFGILLSMLWVAVASVLLVIREARAEDLPEDETSPPPL